MQVFEGDGATHMKRAALIVLVLLGLFLAAKTIAEIAQFRYIGTGIPAMNTISVEGDGEAVAIPDTAQFSFSVVEKQSTVAKAQEEATKKMDALVQYLKGEGIDEKDYKTVSYSVYPQYEWQNIACSPGAYCAPGKQTLTGYEVRQTIEVKVKDTDKAGALLSGVGEKGATELSGLTFTVEDEDALKEEARSEAIEKAQEQADMLSDKLGVKLVRIVNFSESTGGGYPPTPYYSYGRGGDGAMAQEVKAANVPIPEGENKISSHVMVTYEIR